MPVADQKDAEPSDTIQAAALAVAALLGADTAGVPLPPAPWMPNAFHPIRGLLLETTLELLRTSNKER